MTTIAKKNEGLKQLRKRIDITKLTKMRARVVIAKDVIAAIDAEKLQPMCGRYVEVSFNRPLLLDGAELRDVMPDMNSCTVCALGGLLMSCVARFDKFKLSLLQCSATTIDLGREPIMDRLLPYFTYRELREIEHVFEQGRVSRLDGVRYGVSLYKLPPDARLKALMQIIVDNKGKWIMPE